MWAESLVNRTGVQTLFRRLHHGSGIVATVDDVRIETSNLQQLQSVIRLYLHTYVIFTLVIKCVLIEKVVELQSCMMWYRNSVDNRSKYAWDIPVPATQQSIDEKCRL